ncbi:MAG: lipase family protein [Micrococcus sp.]|nr:lipase family protein [Micrococcus sp.]
MQVSASSGGSAERGWRRPVRARLLAAAAALGVVAGLTATPAGAAPGVGVPSAAGIGVPAAPGVEVPGAPLPTDARVQEALTELSTAPSARDEAAWEQARAQMAEQAPKDFYATPAQIPGTPGTLLRQQPMAFYLDPVQRIQVPARGTRIMYSSLNAAGQPIAVTGSVLEPTAPWRGRGQRPVIGYAVGTQGLGDQCAPSKTLSTGTQYEGVGISALLSAGYTVVVTDYEGLGTAGTHTYMVREAQAHAVLDSVRAAAAVTDSSVTATSPVALAGYSQGGGAVAAAAELAGSYAPELQVKSAYAGAPPADLVQVARALEGGQSAGYLLFAMAGHLAASTLTAEDYLNAAGLDALERAEQACTGDASQFAGLDSATLTLSGQNFPTLVRADADWAATLAEQRLGAPGRAPRIPVLITHSLTDDVIPYRVGRELGLRWCAQGTRVRFDPVFTPTHVGGYIASLPRAMGFLDATLHERWTPNSCGWF